MGRLCLQCSSNTAPAGSTRGHARLGAHTQLAGKWPREVPLGHKSIAACARNPLPGAAPGPGSREGAMYLHKEVS